MPVQGFQDQNGPPSGPIEAFRYRFEHHIDKTIDSLKATQIQQGLVRSASSRGKRCRKR